MYICQYGGALSARFAASKKFAEYCGKFGAAALDTTEQ